MNSKNNVQKNRTAVLVRRIAVLRHYLIKTGVWNIIAGVSQNTEGFI